MFRIAFDPEQPLVATSTFTAGSDQIAAGDVFDWRARGMQAIDALAMFRSGLLAHPASRVEAAPAASPSQPRRRARR